MQADQVPETQGAVMQKNVIIGHVFQPKDIINIINLFNQNLLAQQQKSGDKDENMQDESNITI